MRSPRSSGRTLSLSESARSSKSCSICLVSTNILLIMFDVKPWHKVLLIFPKIQKKEPDISFRIIRGAKGLDILIKNIGEKTAYNINFVPIGDSVVPFTDNTWELMPYKQLPPNEKLQVLAYIFFGQKQPPYFIRAKWSDIDGRQYQKDMKVLIEA